MFKKDDCNQVESIGQPNFKFSLEDVKKPFINVLSVGKGYLHRSGVEERNWLELRLRRTRRRFEL